MPSIFTPVDAILAALGEITDGKATNALGKQPVMTFALTDEHGRKATIWWSGNDGTWKASIA